MPAGSPRKNGYIYILIEGRQLLAHRLAWHVMHGEWPAGHIDHIDGNPSNNAIANLRDVDRAGNMQNRRRPRFGSATQLIGVSPHGERFRASICLNRKQIHLGVFDSAEQAHAAYLTAKRSIHSTCSI